VGVFKVLTKRRRDSVDTLGIETSWRLLLRERREEGIPNNEYKRDDLREDRSSSSLSSWVPLLFPNPPLPVFSSIWGITFSFPDSAFDMVVLDCGLWRRKIEFMVVGVLPCITAVVLVFVVQKRKQAELVWPSDPDILVQVDLVRTYW